MHHHERTQLAQVALGAMQCTTDIAIDRSFELAALHAASNLITTTDRFIAAANERAPHSPVIVTDFFKGYDLYAILPENYSHVDCGDMVEVLDQNASAGWKDMIVTTLIALDTRTHEEHGYFPIWTFQTESGVKFTLTNSNCREESLRTLGYTTEQIAEFQAEYAQ